MNLSSKQRAYLRSLAHSLKPVAQVGAEGVTDGLVESVREALNTRELLKVKVPESAPEDARGVADELVRRLPGAHVAQVIGRTIVLYRPFPDEPGIRLPS